MDRPKPSAKKFPSYPLGNHLVDFMPGPPSGNPKSVHGRFDRIAQQIMKNEDFVLRIVKSSCTNPGGRPSIPLLIRGLCATKSLITYRNSEHNAACFVYPPGASSGIGRATAKLFAAAGARVAVHYHRAAEQARSLLDTLMPVPHGHLMVQEDVSRAEDVGRIFAETMEAFGSLDILVANAGIWEGRAIVLASQFPIAAWHELIGNPSIADAIIDRLASGAHRIELQGESVRGGNAQSPPTRDGVEVAS